MSRYAKWDFNPGGHVPLLILLSLLLILSFLCFKARSHEPAGMEFQGISDGCSRDLYFIDLPSLCVSFSGAAIKSDV
jgi:hypothetical protein